MTLWDFLDKHLWAVLPAFIIAVLALILIEGAWANACRVIIAWRRIK